VRGGERDERLSNIQVKDQAQYKQEQSSQINCVLILFYVMLALAVVIAFIGIINTLALSILERVRELGLLWAVGMTREHIRSMIRWEAVIIAIVGRPSAWLSDVLWLDARPRAPQPGHHRGRPACRLPADLRRPRCGCRHAGRDLPRPPGGEDRHAAAIAAQ